MYDYLKNYPKDREMGWSHEANGVCHDQENWFFTQNGNLWKFPITHRIGDTCKTKDADVVIDKNGKVTYQKLTRRIYKHEVGLHLGDIDHYNGYIFVPVESNPFCIYVYRASDLTFISRQDVVREDGRPFTSLGWVAINPNTGLLYTSDKHVMNSTAGVYSRIHVYKIGDVKKPGAFSYLSAINLFDEYGSALTLEHMQGGCFDNENHLHVNNGYWTLKGGHSWANSKGGISVFKCNTVSTHSYENLTRLTKSNQSNGFRYQFDGTGDEPEGITYWDLDKDRRAPEINGQLHAIMLNNTGSGDDDFYFKHYRRIYTGFYRVIVTTGSIDGAGTDADLFVTFVGTNGTSKEYVIDSPHDDFERGHIDSFVVETDKPVGTIKQIKIRSNNKGKSSDYYFEKISVVDLEAQKEYHFPGGKWLTSKTPYHILTAL